MKNDSPLNDFSGIARLFPLPNLVMFPAVIQPLHVFEPRYRDMTADALEDDRLLAPVLLQSESPDDYDDKPAIHSIGCLGRIFQEQKLPDGRYNLLLHGVNRIRIREELTTASRYRSASVTLLDEEPMTSTSAEQSIRAELEERLPAWLPSQKAMLMQMQKLFASQLSLGTLCDVLSFALPFDVAAKQCLLETLDVGERVRLLLEHLKAASPHDAAQDGSKGDRPFPPDFSVN